MPTLRQNLLRSKQVKLGPMSGKSCILNVLSGPAHRLTHTLRTFNPYLKARYTAYSPKRSLTTFKIVSPCIVKAHSPTDYTPWTHSLLNLSQSGGRYVSTRPRLDLTSETTEVAVDWQVERLIERFDGFIATHLYDDRLEKEIAAAKKNYREILNLYRSNVLYSVLKYPLSPRLLFLYEDSVRERETNYQRRSSADKKAVEEMVKRSKNPRTKDNMNERYLQQKISNLQVIARLFANKIARAHRTIFPGRVPP